MTIQETNASLLLRLKENPTELDWSDFYNSYSNAIVRYGMKLGLRYEKAQDILQESMVDLMRILPTFEYDPKRGKFRNFVLTIVHRRALKQFRRAQKYEEISLDATSGTGASINRQLASVSEEVDAEAEHMWKLSLYEQCLEQLKSDTEIDARTCAIFIAYAVEGRKPRELAREFGVKENNIYQIKNRIIERMSRQVKELQSGELDYE